MASGRPLIASVDEGSETWNLVKMAKAGICVPPENPSEIVKAIIALKKDKEFSERLGVMDASGPSKIIRLSRLPSNSRSCYWRPFRQKFHDWKFYRERESKPITLEMLYP